MEIEIEYKMFVIVPLQPHMSAGKMASQVAHATFMALEQQRGQEIEDCIDGKNTDKRSIIDLWKESGMCVIVLETPSITELLGYNEYCKQWNIPHHLYVDEGRTEIPAGTPTAFATGVLPSDKHWIFSQMDFFGTQRKGFFKKLMERRD